jgi:hypothetical protein
MKMLELWGLQCGGVQADCCVLDRRENDCQHGSWWFPQGIKRERGHRALVRDAVAAPATVGGELEARSATGDLRISGKAAEGEDPQARRPTTNRGHARTHRAGCPGVANLSAVIGLCRWRREARFAVTFGRAPRIVSAFPPLTCDDLERVSASECRARSAALRPTHAKSQQRRVKVYEYKVAAT